MLVGNGYLQQDFSSIEIEVRELFMYWQWRAVKNAAEKWFLGGGPRGPGGRVEWIISRQWILAPSPLSSGAPSEVLNRHLGRQQRVYRIPSSLNKIHIFSKIIKGSKAL
ncbi:hypothetical protein GOP47_0006753 [Adiantum capillus-veneris]|uniref:Uncharacterized protein n=1 Tax=Adiantum capillus-veneris TaxID=13818 RepID=A0A9D4V484_ADICA|nr:hypothetical protein GOP47_0006753 [Adiantum capillus-veneris]